MIRILATLSLIAVFTVLQTTGWGWTSADESQPIRMTNQPHFSIPFQLAASGNEAAEVHLYVSTDRGQDWRRYQRQPTNASSFQFKSENDGEYWFAVRTVDASGSLLEEARWNPELKVIVDTKRPELDVEAQVDAHGQVVVAWHTRDENLAAHTFRLQYDDGNQGWQDVKVETPHEQTRQTTWQSTTSWYAKKFDGLTIRAIVFDRAGNKRQSEETTLPATRRDDTSRYGTRPKFDTGPIGLVEPQSATDANSRFGEPFRPSNRFETSNTTLETPFSDVQHGTDTFGAVGNRFDTPQFNDRADDVRTKTQPNTNDESEIFRPVAGRPQSRNTKTTRSETKRRPRIIQYPSIELEYAVHDVGPRGVRSVELWVTRDEGAHWELLKTDPDRQSPIDLDLDEEGLYGFRLVVHAFGQRPSPSPKRFDEPDLLIVADWTQPRCRITRAEWIESQDRAQIVIEWTAEDVLLAERPIDLKYATTPNGPWRPVTSGLHNSGSYSWEVPSNVPDRVFIKLEVTDQAGHVGSVTLRNPVSAPGLGARGEVIDIRPKQQNSASLSPQLR